MAATQQQESTLIVGTITQTGNATVTVTKAGMTGSPLAISVAVLQNDTAATSAGKMATAMNLNANFAAVCLAYAVGATLYVTVLVAAANDDTMNVAYTNGTCLGLTADATSDHSRYGDAGTITNGYATLAQFKAQLSTQTVATSSTNDDVINRMIESASRAFDQATYRRFFTTSADETRTYKASSYTRFFTDDIISVTSIKLDIDLDRTYETTLASTDYDLMPENASLNGEPHTYVERSPLGAYSFPMHSKGIQVVGKFGFCAIANVPKAVTDAVLDVVMSLYQSRRGVGVEGIATITAAGVVITPKDFTPFAWRIVEQYRKNWGGY